MRVNNSVVLIVGASRGLGRSTSLVLARHGARLVLTSRSHQNLEILRKELETIGCEVEICPGDASIPESATRVVNVALQRFGKVDVCIYAAGVGALAPVLSTPLDTYRRLIEINFFGAFHYTKALLPLFLSRRKGHFIFVTGIISRKAFANLSAYCASKAALDAFAESLYRELKGLGAATITGDTGVVVSRLWPGAMETDFMDNILNRKNADMGMFPMEHFSLPAISPDKVAKEIIHLIESEQPFRTVPSILSAYHRLNSISPKSADLVSHIAGVLTGASQRRNKKITHTKTNKFSSLEFPSLSLRKRIYPFSNLKDRVVIIVGASGGVGSATAIALAREGARLVLTARSAGALESLANTLRKHGASVSIAPADVTDSNSVAEAVKSIIKREKRIDVLIFAAGVGTLEPVADMSFQHLQNIFAVNFEGNINCLHAVLPIFEVQREGAFIHVSVAIGEKPYENLSAFGSAKIASNTVIRSLQHEFHGTPIQFSNIIPGPVDTPFMSNLINAQETNFSWCMRERMALGLMPPEKVAEGIIFAIKHKRNEYIFPPILKFFLKLNHVVSTRLTDWLAIRYMDWKGVPESCEMPHTLGQRTGKSVTSDKEEKQEGNTL